MRPAHIARFAVGCALAVSGLSAQQPPAPLSPLVKENATVKISEHVYLIPNGNVALTVRNNSSDTASLCVYP